jgi:hypothetical protein
MLGDGESDFVAAREQQWSCIGVEPRTESGGRDR